jgi:hypothetical protein
MTPEERTRLHWSNVFVRRKMAGDSDAMRVCDAIERYILAAAPATDTRTHTQQVTHHGTQQAASRAAGCPVCRVSGAPPRPPRNAAYAPVGPHPFPTKEFSVCPAALAGGAQSGNANVKRRSNRPAVGISDDRNSNHSALCSIFARVRMMPEPP